MAKDRDWIAKIARSRPAEVQRLEKDGPVMKAGQLMLISSPTDIESEIRTIPEGQSVTAADLRGRLAAAAGADVTCPLTTGIFLRIVTEAANQRMDAGEPVSGLVPVWRVIDHKAPLLKKLTFDPQWLMHLRESEGIVG